MRAVKTERGRGGGNALAELRFVCGDKDDCQRIEDRVV